MLHAKGSGALTYGMRHLLHVSAGGLAQGGDAVHAADALCEHGVGGELGELRGPEVGEQDALAGHPVRVDVRQRRRRLAPALSVLATDQDLHLRVQGLAVPFIASKLSVSFLPVNLAAARCWIEQGAADYESAIPNISVTDRNSGMADISL